MVFRTRKTSVVCSILIVVALVIRNFMGLHPTAILTYTKEFHKVEERLQTKNETENTPHTKSTNTSSISPITIRNGQDDDEAVTEIASNRSIDVSLSSTTRTNEKYLILHVGPMKTGTTSIQCALRDLEENGVLEKHRFHLLETENCRPSQHFVEELKEKYNDIKTTGGGEPTYDNVVAGLAWLPGCWLNWKKGEGMPPCWKESYERYLKDSNGTSMIISNENLMKVIATYQMDSESFIQDLMQSLQDAGGYQLIVVATYRRFFDWAVSVHYERNKVLESARPAFKKWPGEGGKPVESFLNMLTASSSSVTRIYPNQFVDRAVAFFSSDHYSQSHHYNLSLEIVDMYQGDNLEYLFFCQAFPNETTLHQSMCQSAEKNATATPRHNQADNNLWYDELTLEAYRRGLLTKKATRRGTIKAIKQFKEEHSNSTYTDFPKRCPPQEAYERLLKESLRREERLLSHLLSNSKDRLSRERLQEQHRLAFDRAISSYKFCTINASAALEDPALLSVFKK